VVHLGTQARLTGRRTENYGHLATIDRFLGGFAGMVTVGPLIGRESELTQLEGMLACTRLLTAQQ